MIDFEKEVEEINNILEKCDKVSFATAEIKAEKLKAEVQSSQCIEKEARVAQIEVIIGMCQAFLGKFDSALKNLESALRKHISFDALDLCDATKALTMLNITKRRVDIIQEAGGIIANFRELRTAVKIGLGEQ